MPHYQFSQETVDWMKEVARELGESAPPDDTATEPDADGATGGLETYERASGTVDPAALGAVARAVYDELVAAGATEIRCSYDGGGDEGFTHFEHAIIGGAPVGVAELGERWRHTSLGDPHGLFGGHDHGLPREQNVREALDELGHALATALLGEGYGTGEYTMYGAFTADLASGTITDLEEV